MQAERCAERAHQDPTARRPEQNELIKTPPACRPGAAQNRLTEIPPACRPETAQSELMAIRQQRAGAIAPRSGADHPPKPAPIERRTVPVRRIVGGGCGWEVRWCRHVRLRGDAGSVVGQGSASAYCAQQHRDQARFSVAPPSISESFRSRHAHAFRVADAGLPFSAQPARRRRGSLRCGELILDQPTRGDWR